MDSNVVIEKSTGKVVCESFDPFLRDRVNLEKYEVMPRSAYDQNSEKVKNDSHK